MTTVLDSFHHCFKTVWNSLSDHLHDPAVDSQQFRRELTTYLFARHSKR